MPQTHRIILILANTLRASSIACNSRHHEVSMYMKGCAETEDASLLLLCPDRALLLPPAAELEVEVREMSEGNRFMVIRSCSWDLRTHADMISSLLSS